MGLFNLTDDKKMALAGLGLGMSQLGAGQPVNLSQPMAAMMDRRQRADQKRALEESGVLNQFTPQQRAILAQMPPQAAQQVISSVLFAPKPQPKITDDMAEYQAAIAQGFQGSLQDWILAQRKAGASTNTVNFPDQQIDFGQPGEGLVWQRNQETGEIMLDERGAPIAIPYQGGKAFITAEAAERAGDAKTQNALTATSIVTTAAQRARAAAEDRVLTGIAGAAASYNPGTDNAEVYRQVDVLKSTAKVENLNAMRAASPTGGALGGVTEGELKMLADKSGALDPASPNFQRDLDDYELTLLRVVHGFKAGTAIFEQTRQDAPSDAPEGVDAGVWRYMTPEERALWD